MPRLHFPRCRSVEQFGGDRLAGPDLAHVAQAARDRVELTRIRRIVREFECAHHRVERQIRFDDAEIERQHRLADIRIQLEPIFRSRNPLPSGGG